MAAKTSQFHSSSTKPAKPTKWVAGAVLLIQLGSVSAFAESSTQNSGFFASLRGMFSTFLGSRDLGPSPSPELTPSPMPISTPIATDSPGSPGSKEEQSAAQPTLNDRVASESSLESVSHSNTVSAVRLTEPEQRNPVVFARRAGYPPAIFKPHENFDPSDPESFARLQDALADDEQANALISFVLNETGKSSLSELVTFKAPVNPFEKGVTLISMDRATPESVLAGWPALDSEGLLIADPRPGDRLHVVVELNPKSEMIELYSTIIHELTHVQGHLKRMKSVHLDELLTFKDADDYSLWNLERPGGEVDAHAAEISAIIRYRNRYGLPYESFSSSPALERDSIVNMKTGEIVNRDELEKVIAGRNVKNGKDNLKAYYSTGIAKFNYMIQQELRYSEGLVQQLKSSPSYDARADVREEARRIDLRIQKIRAQYPSIVN